MSFEDMKWVWKNGELLPRNQTSVDITTHTLHLGSGVFEALRCYQTEEGSAIFRLNEHLERLYASAALYRIEIPYTRAELAEAICQTILRNDLRVCYVRVLCYYGIGSLGVNPRHCPVEVAVLAWPLGAYLSAEGLEAGVRVTISPWRKFHSRMMPTTAKACGQYLNSLLAMREAIGRGYDEAVLLDVEGNIAEGSAENIFIVQNRRLRTNDERSSILLGITRDAVITLARDLGYEVEVGPLSVEDLLGADEAFLTGTAVEVTPIREVDARRIGLVTPGPMTQKIQQRFWGATSGRDATYRDWLHLVAQPAAADSVLS